VFDIGERDELRDQLLAKGRSDDRIVAAALLGSLAADRADRWSDLDLMFAVSDAVLVADVLEAWTRDLGSEREAVRLFDLPSGPIIYRVFLLPGCLELDLSFVPAGEFSPGGPKFQLQFGEALEAADAEPTDAQELFGYGVHHVLHARAAIERGRYWQAEYWISAVRDHSLTLACLRRGLEGWYGRDFDKLPADVLDRARGALVRSLEREELDRALVSAVSALLEESERAGDMVGRLGPQLRELGRLLQPPVPREQRGPTPPTDGA
jgi:hypothetical protein